jgi:hypothetical protein
MHPSYVVQTPKKWWIDVQLTLKNWEETFRLLPYKIKADTGDLPYMI